MKNLYLTNSFRSYTTHTPKSKLNSRGSGRLHLRVLYCYLFHISLTVLSVFFATVSIAQQGINNFTSLNNPVVASKTYTGPGIGIGAQPEYIPSSNNTFTYNFGAASGLPYNLKPVSGYIAGGSSFSVMANIITSVALRRVNNALVTGNRDILFFAGDRTPGINTSGQTSSSLTLNLNAAYVADMGTAFSQNNLLIDTDNIFSNQGNGNGNNNNIERVDVMISGGIDIVDGQTYGFPILERGTYGVHDAFKAAVITGIDASGNPSSYSNVVSVTASNYNNTNGANPLADGIYTYYLFKRDGTNDLQIDQHVTGQGIGGVSFRFSDFGISNGTTIYGYSLMANDFNSTSGSDVVDYTNSSHFPTNTSESAGGGLDILAVLGIAKENSILPVELSSFTASENAGKSQLEWTTLTETNNRGFEVERSTNGNEWMKIGFVFSKGSEGNSTQKLQYSYTDNNPLPGDNYYRLKQYDLDNHEKISEVRIVSIDDHDFKVMTAFPNPARDHIYIQGVEPGTTLRLTDMKGAIIVNSITTKASVELMPADKLSPGIYLLQAIRNNTILKTIKMVKM